MDEIKIKKELARLKSALCAGRGKETYGKHNAGHKGMLYMPADNDAE